MAKKRSPGEGSIYKESSGLWTAEIHLPDGTRKRKRSKRQQVVREWLHLTKESARQGMVIKDEKITVADFLDKYITDVATPTLKPKTIDSYKHLIEKHIKPEIGKIYLSSLKPDQLQALYSKKLSGGYSKRTVQYIHAVIRRSFNYAVKWGYLYRNPTDAVTPPVPKKKAPDTLTEDEVNTLLFSLKDHRWYPIYVLAIATGMREGEILGLRWEDVNFATSTISVSQIVYSIRGKIYIGDPKTDASRRTISVPGYAMAVLKNHHDTTGKTGGLVFTTSSGKPVSPRNLLRHFHQSLEKAGMERMRFHDLRHTCATIMLKMNIHPKVVQELLGHSTITLTLDTYSSVMPGIQKEAAEKMNGIFKVGK